jgi:hypothetical protein
MVEIQFGGPQKGQYHFPWPTDGKETLRRYPWSCSTDKEIQNEDISSQTKTNRIRTIV